MPHQCVRCGALYEDGAKEILTGCPKCGGKLFFYIPKEKFEKLKKENDKNIKLSKEEREELEKDVYDIIGDKIDKDKPVILDIEAIRLLKPGKYELDLVKLFKGEPLIFRVEDGKYILDISSLFEKLRRE